MTRSKTELIYHTIRHEYQLDLSSANAWPFCRKLLYLCNAIVHLRPFLEYKSQTAYIPLMENLQLKERLVHADFSRTQKSQPQLSLLFVSRVLQQSSLSITLHKTLVALTINPIDLQHFSIFHAIVFKCFLFDLLLFGFYNARECRITRLVTPQICNSHHRR